MSNPNSAADAAGPVRPFHPLWLIVPLAGTGVFLLFLLVASTVLPEPTGPSAAEVFTPAETAVGRVRADLYDSLRLLGIFITLLFYGGLLVSKGAGRLDRFSSRLARGRPLFAALIFAAGLVLGLFVVRLPLVFYGGYILPHRFGLSDQSVLAWAGRTGMNLALYGGIQVLAAAGALTLIRRLGRRACFPLAGAVILTGVLLVLLKPVLMDPLFHRFTPLEDPGLGMRIEALVEQADLDVEAIYVMDASRRTRSLNAYFTGLLGSSRIVLYDNLIHQAPPEEVLGILGHEAGHRIEGHIPIGLGLFALSALAFIPAFFVLLNRLERAGYFRGLDDRRVLVLLGLVLTLVLTASAPIQGLLSRHFERQADRWELRLADDPETFEAATTRLVRKNRSDPGARPFFYWFGRSHPTALERIGVARAWKRDAASGP